MAYPALTVAILAGGAATRLGGRDKGLEPLGGRPLIEWVIEYCAMHLGITTPFESTELLIIANRHLPEYARYAPTYRDLAIGFHGPLAGVASALAHASAPHVLTLPVDSPRPPENLASRLLTAMDQHGASAAFAHDGERRQPLFALYRRELADAADAAAAQGQGVWEWQDAIGAIGVDFADCRQQFHNLNTPEDFSAYADVARTRE
ncbi:MAG TPA: molybdenum cofactor guanylyltransferase MobA [Rhodanobacteraceae bacterium]|jgi:molybdopterin-guanine dinucleotide biosynthesis protein A